jgi:hypothetical protein
VGSEPERVAHEEDCQIKGPGGRRRRPLIALERAPADGANDSSPPTFAKGRNARNQLANRAGQAVKRGEGLLALDRLDGGGKGDIPIANDRLIDGKTLLSAKLFRIGSQGEPAINSMKYPRSSRAWV